MDDAATMGFVKTLTNLTGNFERFCLRQTPATLLVSRKCLALEQLHGEEVHVALCAVSSVDFVNTANVWVAHSQRTLNFRREPWLESWLCRLDGNASAQLAIEGFIDHAHSAFSDVANDFEALRDYFSGLKCGRGVFERDCGMKEERTHPFLPFYDIASFLQQVGIIGAGLSQVG